MEPSPGADPGRLPYRGKVTAVCDGKAPAQATAVASASREPPPGADPGHPPYEGGAAAVRGGLSWGIKIRT
jgi:hypothetical protein